VGNPTPDWPTAPPLPASPTVDPLLPTGDGYGGAAVGASNPTQAALAAEGEPDAQGPTITPQPTAAQLPMMITAGDGLVLQATFYGPAARPAPAVLLLPMQDRDRGSWTLLAERLQAAGYAVLTVDLRGYGETGGQPDWRQAQDDVRAALAMLSELSGVNRSQLIVIGAGIGANLGLNLCAETSGCAATVLLSPGLDVQGITTAEAMGRLGARPVLIISGENDNNNPADSVTLGSLARGDHQLVIVPISAHGTDLFDAQPGLLDQIAQWLAARVPPGAALPTPTAG